MENHRGPTTKALRLPTGRGRSGGRMADERNAAGVTGRGFGLARPARSGRRKRVLTVEVDAKRDAPLFPK